MSSLLTPEILAAIGKSAPPRHEVATRRDIRHYAMATRQTNPRYLSGDEAPPLYYTALFWPEAPLEELSVDGLVVDAFLPPLPLKRVMAGGVRVSYTRAIRPDDALVATRTLRDLREKEGKTGPLIFVDVEMVIATEGGEDVLREMTTRIAR